MTRTILKRVCRAVVAGSLALGLAACGPEYDRTEITAVTPSALGGSMNAHSLEVPEGLILKAHIVVWNDDNVQMPLFVRSRDPAIVEVAGVVNERDYAFIGVRQGTTQIDFVADGSVVLSIPATVTAQSSPP
ncbi:MAG TPA: hypothetical protein VM580_33990 [Labilithrix sp.]|jgi:hypothetical protein|nr:hypothetical protein [Labilithrix sp.]